MPLLSTSASDAAAALRTGHLAALPTETVYGLAGDACSEAAVRQIYALKGRPSTNPLIVHVSDVSMAQRYVQWNPLAQALSDAFWPGALTLILPEKPGSGIAAPVRAGGNTLAVRCPAHPLMREVLAAFDGGLAAPSANRSGRISPTSAAHVMEEFADTDLLILDGGPCRIGLESTVVDCTAEMPVVLRPGSIDEEAVATVWKKYKACSADLSGHEPPEGAAKAFSAEHAQATSIGLADADTLKSPGMLSSHYAPRLPVRMNATRAEAGEALLGFGATDGDLNLSPSGNLKEAAANLFDYLRKLDNAAFTGIAIAPIPAEGIGVAITDRIARAAAPRPCGETSDSPQ